MAKIVIIYSGGMDSFTLLHKAISEKHDISVLTFNYGQRHEREIRFARQNCIEHCISQQVVDLRSLTFLLRGSALTQMDIDVPEGHYEHESMKLTVVPGRNTIMLSIAMGYAQSIGATEVWYGAHAGDHAIYPDCRADYIVDMHNTFHSATEGLVSLEAPFLKLTKGEILAEGLNNGLTPEDYTKTYTCYKGEHVPCGKCGSCQERREAFEHCGIIDPTAAHV